MPARFAVAAGKDAPPAVGLSGGFEQTGAITICPMQGRPFGFIVCRALAAAAALPAVAPDSSDRAAAALPTVATDSSGPSLAVLRRPYRASDRLPRAAGVPPHRAKSSRLAWDRY